MTVVPILADMLVHIKYFSFTSLMLIHNIKDTCNSLLPIYYDYNNVT